MNEITLKPESMDIVADNIEKLKTIFPDVFCEDKVDFVKLQEVLGEYVEDKQERYNFTWNGKSNALRLSQIPSTGTLLPCIEESKNWDTTENLYIEGDNLEVLKLLQKTYHSKVKMIYIDPPYNTGKDFVYSDDFKDNLQNYLEITGQKDSEGNKLSTNSETSGRYHTNWLNMMYPRLRLAKNLLTDDGAIFISIDDVEVDNLKKICNEIFGEDNFIESIIWKKRSGPPNDKVIAATHEYIIAFAKDINSLNLHYKSRNEKQLSRYKNPDNHPKGRWAADNLMANVKGGRFVQSLYYPIINPNTGEEHYPSSNGNWRFNKDKMDDLLKNNEIYFGEDGKGRPKLKRFLCDVKDGVATGTIWDDVGYNNTATKEIESIFGNVNIFDTPKPTTLIKQILNLAAKEDDIILDFFSGSAATSHSIMQLNAEDQLNRKFIVVQLPEICEKITEPYKAGYKNICEIGKERIRRAGEQIKEENKDKEGIDKLDVGFKVLKLDSSNLKKWNPDYQNLERSLFDSVENYVEARTELDVLYEIMLKRGIDLTLSIEEIDIQGKKVYSIGFGQLVICLDSEITTDIANAIIEHKKQKEVESMAVVFRDNGFKNDSVKTNIKETLKVADIKDFVTV